MRFYLIIVIIALIGITPLFSGNNVLKFEDFFTVYRVGTPVVSPVDQSITFTVKQANINENNYSTQIWVMDGDGQNQKQLTSHSSASLNPVFSPAGNTLYFLSSRSGTSQIWKMTLTGGEPR